MKTVNILIIASTSLTVIGILLKVWIFDAIVRMGLRDQVSLKKRNEVRDIYLKIPFPLNFKIFFFNVSNPMEIQSGAKPIVKEVGPYWYDEFKEKVDVVDNDTEDSLTYTPYDIYRFNQNKSGSLRQDDVITILHPVLVGMVSLVARDSPVFLSIVNKSIEYIFNSPESIFLTAKVKDILFDGLELNCTNPDFPPTAVCGQMKGQIPGLKFRDEAQKIFLFSLLGSRNGTVKKRLKILRGIEHNADLGRLIEVDGQTSLNLWSEDRCNRFEGTDGWIFPPLTKAEDGLRAYSTELCRNTVVQYVNDTVYKKVNVRIYETELGDQTNDVNEKCFCRTEDSCLKKGLFDLTKCMGVPIIATLPHFLHTDPSYLKMIDGLSPDDSKHALRLYFDGMTGTPLQANKRMQLNFYIESIQKVSLFANLPTTLFPVFWLEESVDLEGEFLKKVQTIHKVLHIASISLYLLIAGGIALFCYAMFKRQKNHREVAITPIPKAKVKTISYADSDLNGLTVKNGQGVDKGVDNHAMSGREFKRY